MDDNGPWRQPFSPALLVAGFGTLWCADYDHPVLVRVEPGHGPRVAASLPDARDVDGEPAGPRGPRALSAGLGAVWVLTGDGRTLLRVDPESGESSALGLPFEFADIAAGPGAVFGIEGLGEGRIARIAPGGEVGVAAAGRALSCVEASGRFVWTVDDATSTVLALDAATLAPVRAFHQLGEPGALCARGSRAWYACAAVAERPGRNGHPERAFIVGSEGFQTRLFRFDAETGNAGMIRSFPAGAPAVMEIDGDSLWINGAQWEDDDADEPATLLLRFAEDGRELATAQVPGTVDALAVADGSLWVSGFRRSRQAYVLTTLDGQGRTAAETGFGGLGLPAANPPAPPAAPPPPLTERARMLRDLVEADLGQPQQSSDRFGRLSLVPPVSEEFELDRVEVRGPADAPEIAVLFRWDGEDGLFGMSFPVPTAGQETWISVYVQENLLAAGRGVENAVREPADGVTWLRWP